MTVPRSQDDQISTGSMPNLVAMYRSPVYKWMALNGRRYGWFPLSARPAVSTGNTTRRGSVQGAIRSDGAPRRRVGLRRATGLFEEYTHVGGLGIARYTAKE